MAINLQDIRSAVINYIDTKVTVSISPLNPAAGLTVGPDEQFGFTLKAKNADIPLKNVIWHVWVENSSVGKLIVPASPKAHSSLYPSEANKLTPGTSVAGMYLFPPSTIFFPFPVVDAMPIIPDPAGYLGVDDTDSISLQGKAGSTATGGITNIRFNIYAECDMDWLFPKSQDSATAIRALTVVG
ncbi:hypothetical protein [Thiothrix fructosivorans]|uniref:Uncharacterized protein n=1 Tax=Thiothrix fructosivorans TaxID=111770 RepID=A0A8B0SMS4_9GAMM|nr:hypothetical protein [Thiothrix fructosivorans]MBO0612325.1 hypothetical protein [Thiothrix fructosivorans]QTX12189.1 hypothetical protein J1836_007650 [Thiothrix fructosivorans]